MPGRCSSSVRTREGLMNILIRPAMRALGVIGASFLLLPGIATAAQKGQSEPVLIGVPAIAVPQAAVANSGIASGFEQFALPGNDDGSTAAVKLPFGITFYGKSYKALYINNNGNVTFGSPTSQYTPSPLSKLTSPMIAPFWADVDTRVGNVVKYGTGTVNGHPAFGVTWPGVGCYSETDSVTNTFQLLLVSRPDTGTGNFDIEFNYGLVEWDSGQASGGNGSCLGGSSAAAGYTSGKGASYELPGSGIDNALLSSNPTTGLSNQSYNSSEPGVDVFPVRSGQPTPGATNAYVALGDSYASGLGSFSYILNTKGSPAPCYRATNGYAKQIAESQHYSLGFAACAGATIGNIVTGGSAQIHQVEHGTQLITLSVGGDDVGFSHVLDDCVGGVGVKGGTGCATRDESAAQAALGWLEDGRAPGTYTLPGIQSARNASHPTSTNTTRLPSLSELYEEVVAAAAPGAHLMVVGYPDLFETAISPVTECQVGTALGVDKLNIAATDVEWLNERANQLDEVIANAVTAAASKTGANISFVNARAPLFSGGVCDTNEYINPLLFKGATWTLEPESFHPNETGQSLLASAIEGALP
jgi:lysophospholipase L1-like esterase